MSNLSPVSSIAAPDAAILKRDSESGVRLMHTAIFTGRTPCERIHIRLGGEQMELKGDPHQNDTGRVDRMTRSLGPSAIFGSGGPPVAPAARLLRAVSPLRAPDRC